MKEKIKVRNSGMVKLNYFDDHPDGILGVDEAKKYTP